ncbi:unnamed protein product [Amoebophrya sp. A120]|nr:unnamed protein product [Amoebophrya sp. A120]|eukprot:GSA120T00001933001.1
MTLAYPVAFRQKNVSPKKRQSIYREVFHIHASIGAEHIYFEWSRSTLNLHNHQSCDTSR